MPLISCGIIYCHITGEPLEIIWDMERQMVYSSPCLCALHSDVYAATEERGCAKFGLRKNIYSPRRAEDQLKDYELMIEYKFIPKCIYELTILRS